MSYDIFLRKPLCPTCGHRESYEGSMSLPNPTYNLTPMFDFALTGEDWPEDQPSEGAVVILGVKTDRPRGLRVLTGQTGLESIPLLCKAIERMHDTRLADKIQALNPVNGWGDSKGAISSLQKLRNAAEAFPEGVWDIR